MKKSSWYKGYHKLRNKGYSKEKAYKTMNNFAKMNRNNYSNSRNKNNKNNKNKKVHPKIRARQIRKKRNLDYSHYGDKKIFNQLMKEGYSEDDAWSGVE